MVTTSADVTRTFTAAKIFHRKKWADEWVEITNADSVIASKSLGSSIGRATFTVRNGRMLLPGDANISVVALDVESMLGNYVKIELTMELKPEETEPTKQYWYGIMTDARQEILGVHEYESEKVISENWFVNCHDFKWLLARKQVTKSLVVENGIVVEIERCLVFNAPWGQELDTQNTIGNFDASDMVFAEFFVSSSKWNSASIIEYLFEHYAPLDGVLTWKLDEAQTIEWFEPIVPQQDRTVLEIINDCIPRQRAMTFSLDVDEDNSEVTLKPISFLHEQIDLPSGIQIPANADILVLDVAEQPHIKSMSRSVSKQETYNQVRIVGERRGLVATYRVGVELFKSWSAADETAYKDGASGAIGYGGLTLSEKAQANDSARMSNKDGVYTEFALPDSWSGQVLGQDIAEPYWTNGLRFESITPLLTKYDYSEPSSPTLTGNREGEFEKAFVITSLDPITRFERVDKLSSSSLLEHYGRGLDFACHVEMMRNRPGIVVRPTAAPHVIADNHFDPATEEPSDYFPKLDFDTFEATLYCRLDTFCEGVYPATPTGEDSDESSVLTISIGATAKLDEIFQNTVLGLVDGEKVTAGGTAFIRDDRELCEDIARAAWVIYGTPRQKVDLSLSRITDEIPLGNLISTYTIGAKTVDINALVTSITWDTVRGMTEIVTEYAELDVVGLA